MTVGPHDPTRTAASPPEGAFEKPPQDADGGAEPFPQIPGYRVLKKLGQGGQGSVYLAESMDGLGKQTAIKLFPKEAKASYARELEAWRRVEEIRRASGTPHLVEGYNAGTTPDGQTFVVMAYFEKASLADRLTAEGPLTPHSAVRYTRHVLAALDLLHKHGLFHRDVKPQNVLLGSDGIARLADYGLSKPLGTSVTGSCTPAFAAPEQLAGEAGSSGIKIDIYGVGATLFALVAGKPPVPGRPDVFLLEKMKVPRPVQAVLLRALNPDPAVRFDDASGFAKALHEADPSSSGVMTIPEIEAAGQRALGVSDVVSPTVASTPDSPFVRTPDVSLDAKTQEAPKHDASTISRIRVARARALIGLAALLAGVAFVADAVRGPGQRWIGAWISGHQPLALPSPTEPTPQPHASPSPSTDRLRTEPLLGPLSLEGVLALAASDQGLALITSASALVPRGETLARVAGRVTAAVPWSSDQVLILRPSGALELVDASGIRRLELGADAHGASVLAAHAASGRIALALPSDALLVMTLDGAGKVLSRTSLPTAGGLATGLAFDEHGERLALASLGADGVGHVSIFACGSEPVVDRVLDDPGPLALAWLSSSALALGGLRGEVAVLDLATGRRARTLPAFEDEVTSLVRVPGADLVLALGDDRKLETARFPGSFAVSDSSGATLWFAARPRPRLRAWRTSALLGKGDLVPVVDSTTLELSRLR